MRMPPSSMEHHTCGTRFDKTCDMGGQRNPSAQYRTCQIPWIRRRSPRIVFISCFTLLNHREHKIMHICIRGMQNTMNIYEYAHLSSITFLVTFLAAPRHLLISSPEVQLRNPALERQQLRNAHLLMNMGLFFKQ